MDTNKKKKRNDLAFLGRGVLRMERDSVMHSTISSAASARLRQNSMASATSPLLGVKARSISSSLSRSLQTQGGGVCRSGGKVK